MSDIAYRNASAKRDELAAQISELDQKLHARQTELRQIDQWLEMWRSFAGSASSLTSPSDAEPSHSECEAAIAASGPVDSYKPERTRTTGNPKKEFVAAVAREIIEQAQQPVSRGDLFKELAARDLVIEGKDPEQVLSTMLWRTRDDFKIVRLPAGGYWLAERPHEESGYDPETSPLSKDVGEGGTEEVVQQTQPAQANKFARFGFPSARGRHAALSAKIAEADRIYHGEDAPVISDFDYDALRRELEDIETRFPELAGTDESTSPASEKADGSGAEGGNGGEDVKEVDAYGRLVEQL